MMRAGLLTFVAALLLAGQVAVAQEQGYWHAADSPARSVTGDVALGENKIVLNNFYSFAMTRVRTLEPAELSSVFDVPSTGAAGQGVLYRLNIPAQQKFQHKNTLCGSDDTTWMVAYAAGRALRIEFFSGEKPPVFTFDAMQNSSQTCGTFAYAR
jgi:hypothetical protein